MKITRNNLQQIVQEEIEQVLLENNWTEDTIRNSINNHGIGKIARHEAAELKRIVEGISLMFHTPAARKKFFEWYNKVYDAPSALRSRS